MLHSVLILDTRQNMKQEANLTTMRCRNQGRMNLHILINLVLHWKPIA